MSSHLQVAPPVVEEFRDYRPPQGVRRDVQSGLTRRAFVEESDEGPEQAEMLREFVKQLPLITPFWGGKRIKYGCLCKHCGSSLRFLRAAGIVLARVLSAHLPEAASQLHPC